MSDPIAPPRRGPSVLLIVSLCLNVALVGLIVIAGWRLAPRMFEPRPINGPLGAQALMRMVPAEKTKIMAILNAHRGRLRDLRAESMRARAAAFHDLTTTEFSADEFARALAAMQGADAALESETINVTAESVAVLTPAERQSLAGKVRQPSDIWLRRFFRRR